MHSRLVALVPLLAGLWACGPSAMPAKATLAPPGPAPLPWEAPAEVPPEVKSAAVAIVGASVLTAIGEPIEDGVVLMRDGRLSAIGTRDQVAVPADARVIDASGRFVTPGLIDTHSHMGVYSVPSLRAHADGNEATAPVTAHVRAADAFWPQDPALPRAVAGGVTTIQVLPGSANLIGGEGVVLKLRPGRSVEEMRFVGAPRTLKMACGENPKRVYGERKTAPSTRMGSVAGYRAAYQKAIEYGRSFREWQQKHQQWSAKQAGSSAGTADGEGDGDAKPDEPSTEPLPPARDFGLESLLGAIEGRVLVQMHCYRADEMLRMVALGKELGFSVRSFHHAVEAYKIRDVLARERIGVSTWADWWGFKAEAFDSVVENLALATEAGVRGVVHSDSADLIQRLNQEAAKALYAGIAAGVSVTPTDALRWITLNPAWVLGIDAHTGSLEVGKMADVVVWSASPFSVYAHADLVFVDGVQVFDRSKGARAGTSDFELGLEPEVR